MERIGSVAKDAIEKFKKTINPLANIFKEPDENVEFAAWHRVAQIKCGNLKNIKNYDDLVNNINLEDIHLSTYEKNESKKKFFEKNKFIHTNNDDNKNFCKIADYLKNGNAIKIKNKKNKLSRYNFLTKFKYIIDYDSIKYEKINDNDDQINIDIINDSTIENIDKKKIKWFYFFKRYENDFNRFNTDYGCNIDKSATGENQVVTEDQNVQSQKQTEGYKTEGIDKHTDVILIIKNDKKKRIEFYKPINITKVKRLTYIVDSKSDRDRKKEKEESKKRLENDFSKLTQRERGYLAQFGGNVELNDIIEAIKYTPIPIFSVRTVEVKYGLWSLDNYDSIDDVECYTLIEYSINNANYQDLINYLQNIISQAKDDPEKLANQLDLTTFEGIKHLEELNKKSAIKDIIIYKFTISDKNYCYKSSNVRVYLVKTSSEFIQEENNTALKDFRSFKNKIDNKIKDLKQREEIILQEANTNVSSNINKSDAIEEKDNERVDKILMNLATFLAYAMKEMGKYLIQAITLIFMLIREVFIALRDFFANFVNGVSGRWSDVAAGAVIFVIFAIIVLGISLGVYYGKKDKPVRNERIDESNNVNEKTLYSIITAIPADISNAYNSFVKFAGTVNTMLFDARKTISEITTEMGYLEDSESLENRDVLYNISDKLNKRVDYIMHFTKHDNPEKVKHNYSPRTPITLSLGDNTPVGLVTINSDDATKKYIPKCKPDSTNSGYIGGDDCKRKEKVCADVSDIPQESVQQIQIEETDFENDYNSIIVST